jgi:hypothetical protein
MKTLKMMGRTVIQMAKRVWSLPQALAHALKFGPRPIVLDEDEIDRLDRLRNPSKYLGK